VNTPDLTASGLFCQPPRNLVPPFLALGATGPPDLGAVEGFVGAPEGFGRQVAGRRLDGVGQRLDVGEVEPLGVGAGVEDLERGDLVLVLPEERLE
jgi:hypothetical protein